MQIGEGSREIDVSNDGPKRVAPAILNGELDGFDTAYPRFVAMADNYRAIADGMGQIIDISERDDGRFLVERRAHAHAPRVAIKVTSADRMAIAALIRRAAENERGASTEDTMITPNYRAHHLFATRFMGAR
jgi:hypothetical protein